MKILAFDLSKKYKKIYSFALCSCMFMAGSLAADTVVVPLGSSIQDAIDGASDGDTIQLSAGTYTQQFQVVSKNLTIVGAGQDVTIIQAPDSSTQLTQDFTFAGINYWCVIMVDNQGAPTSQTVDISQLTVDGNDQQDFDSGFIYGNSDRFFAIGYHNANGTVTNVHTESTRQYVNFNELAGGGIINASDTGTVAFTVTNSVVDTFQRIGIDCRGPALTANINNTTVDRGYVLTANTTTATPNGIQFSDSTVGNISNNTVTNIIGTVLDASGSAIIVYGAGSNVIVSENTLTNNDTGVAGVQCGDGLTVNNNTINYSTYDATNCPEGIVIQDPVGSTTLASNTLNCIPGISLDLSSQDNQNFMLANNSINNTVVGLLITGNTDTGPVVTMHNDSFTSNLYYYIQEITSPNNVWPSTATVSFDGLLSGHITEAQFQDILTRIYDQNNDPTLGLVLAYVTPSSPELDTISPSSGAQSGGNTVTITGSGFISSSTTVNFGATPATDVYVASDSTITCTAPVGTGTVDVTVQTAFGTTPVVTSDEYTYLASPQAPASFTGQIETLMNQPMYILSMQWTASPSGDAAMYRIYKGDVVVFEGLAGFANVFLDCINSKLEALQYTIVAVNASGDESTPKNLVITSE